MWFRGLTVVWFRGLTVVWFHGTDSCVVQGIDLHGSGG